MELEKTVTYSNEEISVIWKPTMCKNSERCWKELPDVFQLGRRPWVNMDGASSARIIEQVKCCPSGALSLKGSVELKQKEKTAAVKQG